MVTTVEVNEVVGREMRSKTGQQTFAVAERPLASGERHGCDAGSEAKHRSMAETIVGCQVLLARGMGWGAYEGMKSFNIEPLVTDVQNVDKSVQIYLPGRLPNMV